MPNHQSNMLAPEQLADLRAESTCDLEMRKVSRVRRKAEQLTPAELEALRKETQHDLKVINQILDSRTANTG